MKKLFVILLLLVSVFSFSQKNNTKNVDESVHEKFKKLEKQYNLYKVYFWSRTLDSETNILTIEIGYTDTKTEKRMYLILTGYYDYKLNKDVITKKTIEKG